eukprot:14512959-Alexandrium_andersonii.AAC.1
MASSERVDSSRLGMEMRSSAGRVACAKTRMPRSNACKKYPGMGAARRRSAATTSSRACTSVRSNATKGLLGASSKKRVPAVARAAPPPPPRALGRLQRRRSLPARARSSSPSARKVRSLAVARSRPV